MYDDFILKLKTGDKLILYWDEKEHVATIVAPMKPLKGGEQTGLIEVAGYDSRTTFWSVTPDGLEPNYGYGQIFKPYPYPHSQTEVSKLHKQVDELEHKVEWLVAKLEEVSKAACVAPTFSDATDRIASGLGKVRAPELKEEPHDPEALRQLIRE
jgi:hypothetical protein